MTTAVDGVADVHAVGVHDPRHDLVVGVDVGRRDVLLGADRVDDLGDVAARQRLELAARHPRRVADDAALAAAERHVRDGALPRHPGGQRRDFVERDVGVIADAALGRAERDVVLHAVAGEDLDLAVVHLDRAGDGDLPLGMREDLPDAGIEPEQARRAVELLEHRVENAAACFHVTPLRRGQHASLAAPPKTQTDQATVGSRLSSQGACCRRRAGAPVADLVTRNLRRVFHPVPLGRVACDFTVVIRPTKHLIHEARYLLLSSLVRLIAHSRGRGGDVMQNWSSK